MTEPHNRAPLAARFSSAIPCAGKRFGPSLSLTRSTLCLLALLGSSAALAQGGPLNDTGQVTCYDNNADTGNVSGNRPDPETAGFDQQDCTQGRAAADAVGVLNKTGGSSVRGRDYSKIANDGSELPASAALGSAPGDWACTRDNVTGLIWEVKVNDAAHLRHQDHTYTWYDTDPAVNGGQPGAIGSSATCNATLANCNTTALRDAVNSAGLCGASDWRMPTPQELQSLLNYGALNFGFAGGFDTVWLPNSPFSLHWSGTTVAGFLNRAWLLTGTEISNITPKTSFLRVRLVRGGP